MLKILCLNVGLLIAATLGTTVQDISVIKELGDKLSFSIYAPSHVESATSYEIKEPSNINQTDIPAVLINYFNDKGSYVFGVREMKNGSDINHENTVFDVKNNTRKSEVVKKKFSFVPRGELVSINGNKAWYEGYIGKNATGGTLKWLDSGTYIELDTTELSRSSLINIAKSMKKIE
ncbi:hypothetical protein [Paenibacillus piscarius]|uniref:hypothetical protein n=1 Tax=Paenibacillus piscarius TaxID=1089681 RepID=UPI001EE7F27A|nr:hypothetical protein [Paenibacillus piscarius]